MNGRGPHRRAVPRVPGWLVAVALAAVAPRVGAAGPAADPLAAAAGRDGWVAYAVPLAVGAGAPCCYSGWQDGKVVKRACRLDGRERGGIFGEIDAPGLRSDARELVVHLRFEGGAVRQVLAVGDDCPVERGAASVRALEGVDPARSADLLLAAARSSGRRDEVADRALHALSLHERVGTDALLAVARDPEQPQAARKQAFFWLGNSDDPRALAELEKVLTR